MGSCPRVSPNILPVTLAFLIFAPFTSALSAQVSQGSLTKQAIAKSLSDDPRALYQALNELKLDGEQVYSVRDLSLRRDAVEFTLNEGTLVLMQPLNGKVTGAVFVGQGHVISAPHDPGERRSLSRFLGVPILDQRFTSLYLRFTDDTAAELMHEVDSNDEATAKPDFPLERWDRGIAVLASPQSLRIMEDMISDHPAPYFYALMQNDSVGRFDVSIDPQRDEDVMIGQSRNDNGVAFYDVWASFRAEDAPEKKTGAFQPLGYTVDSTIADDLSLDGKTTIRLSAVTEGERIVHLELSRNLVVSEITDDGGKSVTFFQNEDLSREEALRRGNDSIVVVLPEAKKAGEQFRLTVTYRGKVITSAGNGVEYVGERGTWFAHLDGEYFAPFELMFRWPRRFTLVATGTKTESNEDGDPKSGTWTSKIPFATAGFNLGEYKVASAGQAPRIQIFANKQLEEAIVARLSEHAAPADTSTGVVDPSTGNLVPVFSAPPPTPGPTAALKDLGGEVSDSIQYFRKMNGDFPFDYLDVAQIPGSFGQGWPGLIYLSTLAFLPTTTQEQAGIGEWAQRTAKNLMPFHEVVHQWWGNETVAASYRDVWIEEGIANYLAILYSDSKKPAERRIAAWLDHYREDLIAKPPGSSESIEETGPLALGIRLGFAKTPDAYGTILYGKGTWVIHMLHELMRQQGARDPDAKFRALLQYVLTKYKYQPLSTLDFQRAVEKYMTPAMDIEGTHRMDWFFDDWVRGTGIPHYAVKFDVKAKAQGFMVSGVVEQKGVEDEFTAPVPLYAIHGVGRPEKLGVVTTSGPETKFHFETRVRPRRILIDPQSTLLCVTN
jgi:hypothetical protein